MERKYDFNGFFVHPMSNKNAIRHYFPSFSSPNTTNQEHTSYNEITVGPAGELTHTCAETITGPYLSFDSISWDDYFVLDIKAGSFVSGMGQKVITKILNNNQKKIKITLYSADRYMTKGVPNKKRLKNRLHYERLMIAKIFDFFNQIENTSKIICLEYKVKCGNNQDVYMEGLKNLKTDIFSDIEIWRCISPKVQTECHNHPWKVCKWEE
tara:strand:- start:572 stop:1204 length:633 start_codon:yes stop_codon:yes gene_type:complete